MLMLENCWAKTDKETGEPVLSVKEHCLIVGHVAKAIFESLPVQQQELLPKGCITTIAAHDMGKLTPGFQLKAPKWKYYDKVRNSVIAEALETNHAIVSQSHLQQFAVSDGNLQAKYWFISTGGHHGSYPNGLKGRIPRFLEGGIDGFFQLREQLLRILMDRFGPLPTESGKRESERIHFFTGFTIFADWIGSNSDPSWFPYSIDIEPNTLEDRAKEILERLGWNVSVNAGIPFGAQFEPSAPERFLPRPLQAAILKAADSPGLYVVEAPMGEGKTEAALATAYQRWTEGEERGLYFALPTQLTSNKIHDRITHFLENTLGSSAVQTLIHGNAWLGENQTKALTPHFSETGKSTPELDHNDTDEVLRWYSTTRKALIAPFGTGTIDQALLAILPARFAALRYFALAGKVVVIDEVHSYDPYMSALIDRLIRYLLKAGSTVIILSATLTAQRRAGLVAAAGVEETNPPSSYPLITKVKTGDTSPEYFPIPNTQDPKSIRFSHHTLNQETENTFWSQIAEQIEAGANVVIIRNSVALAQQTYHLLKSLLTEKTTSQNTGLLHSRFPQWQRENQEEYWTGILGKDDSQRPQGSLLVSTQIVEQSVDIDADLLITDIAPTDLILQRIGRLHRHNRKRPQGYEQPTCHILHPDTDWAGSPKEVKTALAPHHFIYPPLTLWQATTLLSTFSKISLPDQIRDLLETSSKLRPPKDAAEALEEFTADYERECQAQTSTAHIRDVFNAVAIQDTEGTETRYGMKPTAELVLLTQKPVEHAGQITLHFQHGPSISVRNGEFCYPLAKALQLNSIRIPAYLIKDLIPASPNWLQQHLSRAVIAILQEDTTELELYPHSDIPYQLSYHSRTGLTYEKKPHVPPDPEPFSEDSWF